LLQGELRIQQKNLAAAERAFLRASELAPGSTAATLGLVRIDMVRGQRTAALARVDRIVAAGPSNAENLLLAARTYVTLNEWRKAENTFRKALEVDSSRNEAYGMLGSLFVMQGKLDEALKEFQSAASRDPKSVIAQTMTGTILERQNRRAEAKEAYRHALASGPNAVVAANNLASLMAEDNENLDQALQLAQTAKAGLPDSPDVADTLGSIYYKKGLHAQAVSAFRESAQQQPNRATFQFHLGLAYAKNGDLTLARKTLEAALKMDPKAPEAGEAHAALSQLANVGS
jgi:tetratricopeptide (TPR) repeat protein